MDSLVIFPPFPLTFHLPYQRPGPNPLLASSTEDAKSSPSVAAIATDTPLEERMNQLSTSNELQDLPSQDQAMPPPPIVAPGDVQWYYTDPAGQQQGESSNVDHLAKANRSPPAPLQVLSPRLKCRIGSHTITLSTTFLSAESTKASIIP